MKAVLLVGAGNLGRRHLQSLKSCEHDIDIFVVDPSQESRELAQAAFEQVEKSGGSKTIRFYTSLDHIDTRIDIAIIATPATGRLDILDSVLIKGADHLILEKIAFNSLADIDNAASLIANNAEGVWVNCPRRLNEFYIDLREKLLDDVVESFDVVGENFGLACNAIHFIDLFSFLSRKNNYQVSVEKINQIVPSKRDLYIEFFGEVSGKFENEVAFNLLCNETTGGVDFKITVNSRKFTYIIDEINGDVHIFNRDTGESENNCFRQPYQSELTGPLVDDIIERKGCQLTPFDESMSLHQPFIEAAYELYSTQYGENSQKRVPIT